MPGPDLRRLALISSTQAYDHGLTTSRVGTGYFVTRRLVLTAFHVVAGDRQSVIEVRVEKGAPLWRKDCRIVWKNKSLDAALIEADPPLPEDLPAVVWHDTLLSGYLTWTSAAYPRAAMHPDGQTVEYKTAGLQGRLYVGGGGGQGLPELDLGVDDHPKMEDWEGASGAPVFADDALVGHIKSTGYDGSRFHGTPATTLWQDAAFRIAIEPPWLDCPAEGDWVLALRSEKGGKGFAELIAKSLERHSEQLAKATGRTLAENAVVEIAISEAVESPARWLTLVEALCAAPLMVADVTGLEPAIMLALGVRAVVRRGVTVASTGDYLSEETLTTLPFNIQESKLISHGKSSENPQSRDSRHPLNTIAKALEKRILEQRSNPNYLDLPAYSAVRCPRPDFSISGEPIFALCSFQAEYAEHWRQLLEALANECPTADIVRMRDVHSPRLVGQALYEQIRWTTLCVVDWTHWRPNVFFEFGVRLACSKHEPLSLLEDDEAEVDALQKQRLIALFGPTRYAASDPRLAIKAALACRSNGKMAPGKQTSSDKQNDASQFRTLTSLKQQRVPADATYNVCLAKFDFGQERATLLPHDFLRLSNEATMGKDRQRTAEIPVLFAANEGFFSELTRSTRERWIAAWLYLRHRHSDHELHGNPTLFEELARLGEAVLQELKDIIDDEFISQLRRQVVDLIGQASQREHDVSDVIKRIADLKTQAKNRRDLRLWSDAAAFLRQAIELGSREFAEAGELPEWRARIAAQLADCWGLLGGVERRWGLEFGDQDPRCRLEHLDLSIKAYDEGYRFDLMDPSGRATYNRLNRLIVRLHRDPRVMAREALGTRDAIDVRRELEALAREIGGRDVEDAWSALDMALINVLLSKQDAEAAYGPFERMNAPEFTRQSALDVIAPLAELDLPAAPELRNAEQRLRKAMGSLVA